MVVWQVHSRHSPWHCAFRSCRFSFLASAVVAPSQLRKNWPTFYRSVGLTRSEIRDLCQWFQPFQCKLLPSVSLGCPPAAQVNLIAMQATCDDVIWPELLARIWDEGRDYGLRERLGNAREWGKETIVNADMFRLGSTWLSRLPGYKGIHKKVKDTNISDCAPQLLRSTG